MTKENLLEHITPLISYMEEQGYSQTYIDMVKGEASRIERHVSEFGWNSYDDVYDTLASRELSLQTLKVKRTCLGLLKAFDENNIFPDGRKTKLLIPRSTYSQLCPEFKSVIDYAAEASATHNLMQSTINSRQLEASAFFFAMQQRGCKTIAEITESDALSFFVKEDHGTYVSIRNGGSASKIRSFLKDAVNWHDGLCEQLITYLPEPWNSTKNIQYLTESEIVAVRKVLDGDGLSLRNKAIGELLLQYGLRSSDITGLLRTSIDWEHDVLNIIQQKTKVPLTLPLTARVGNSLYDYITIERPNVDCVYVFTSETIPYRRLAADSIGSITNKIYALAGIRQTKGERRGSHIFRHRVVSAMLERGIAKPVISATVGHTDPSSLNPYAHADRVHLMERALDVSKFSEEASDS